MCRSFSIPLKRVETVDGHQIMALGASRYTACEDATGGYRGPGYMLQSQGVASCLTSVSTATARSGRRAQRALGQKIDWYTSPVNGRHLRPDRRPQPHGQQQHRTGHPVRR